MKLFSRFIFLLLGIFYSLFSFAKDTDLIGKPLPGFSLPMLDRPVQQFASSKICGKVALVNVWSSWCGACQYEHAVLTRIAATTHIPIYGLNYEDNTENALAVLKHKGNPYQVVMIDADGSVADMLNVFGLPETYIIDANGLIRYAFRGAITEESWQNMLYPLIRKIEAEPLSKKPLCER